MATFNASRCSFARSTCSDLISAKIEGAELLRDSALNFSKASSSIQSQSETASLVNCAALAIEEAKRFLCFSCHFAITFRGLPAPGCSPPAFSCGNPNPCLINPASGSFAAFAACSSRSRSSALTRNLI